MTENGEQLAAKVQGFQKATGEANMVVIVEFNDGSMKVHQAGYEYPAGLLIDGLPPTVRWIQNVETFHPMEWPPAVLH